MPSKKEKEALAKKEKELLGEAHKIFERFARVKTDKKQAKKAMLSKELLTDLVKQMQKEMRIGFVSEAKLKRFVSENFKKYDEDKSGALTLEEFVQFYRDWLLSDANAQMHKLKSTQDELERLFLMFDQDASMTLAKDELIKMMQSKEQSGYRPCSEHELGEIASKVVKKFDMDRSVREQQREIRAHAHARIAPQLTLLRFSK